MILGLVFLVVADYYALKWGKDRSFETKEALAMNLLIAFIFCLSSLVDGAFFKWLNS